MIITNILTVLVLSAPTAGNKAVVDWLDAKPSCHEMREHSDKTDTPDALSIVNTLVTEELTTVQVVAALQELNHHHAGDVKQPVLSFLFELAQSPKMIRVSLETEQSEQEDLRFLKWFETRVSKMAFDALASHEPASLQNYVLKWAEGKQPALRDRSLAWLERRRSK